MLHGLCPGGGVLIDRGGWGVWCAARRLDGEREGFFLVGLGFSLFMFGVCVAVVYTQVGSFFGGGWNFS